MISTNPYRKLLLDSYFLMLSTQIAYCNLAMQICLLDELKELDGYMEGENYHQDVFSMIEDKAVQRIYRFLTETDVFAQALDEANNFLNEELDLYGEYATPACLEKLDRSEILGMLLLYTEQVVSEIHIFINKLCDINFDPPMTDYANTTGYDDENVKFIAAFYNKVLEMINEFIETQIWLEE
jgi:hypothetical protein